MRGPRYTQDVGGIRGIVGALMAVLILVGGVESAGAATLKAAYRFQGDLSSEVPGAPALEDLGQGNRFALEQIDGLGLRHVLRFPKGNGLSLTTTGLVDPANHSVVMVFRLADTTGKPTGYRRILDFSRGTSDTGLYNYKGQVALYGGRDGGDTSGNIVLSSNSFVEIALTNAADPEGGEQATAYVNGVKVAAARIAQGFDLGSGVLRFFRDNASGAYPGEESSGAVSCILVYDGTLTANEVKSVAGASSPCPAPSPARQAKALVTGKPRAIGGRRSITVETGLTVSCPIGVTACRASGRVAALPRRSEPASRRGRLGAVGFRVPAGESRSVRVRLSRRGARALRAAGALKVRVSAEIETAAGRVAKSRQTGEIRAPRQPAFRFGTYSGTTSQGLPIVITVGRTEVRSVFFRWRGICSDGKEHSSAVYIQAAADVHRGRFSLGGELDTGGSARISGRLKDLRAWGTLSRAGTIASGARCTVKEIRWHARNSKIEVGPSD